MLPPIYYVLLCMQGGLANFVIPQLRAVTIDLDHKKHELLPSFFFDCKITQELYEECAVSLDEVNPNTKEHYFCRAQILQLDYPNSIPIQGKLAYLRYEPRLPEIKRENRAFLLRESLPHAVFRLDMQEALLGKVTPALRHVGVGVDSDQRKLIAHFIYDGEISDLDFKLANAAIQESRISLPDYEMESVIERVDFPNEMTHRGNWLAYWRLEWKYLADGSRVATIPYS